VSGTITIIAMVLPMLATLAGLWLGAGAGD
jgi:hypothetical protein